MTAREGEYGSCAWYLANKQFIFWPVRTQVDINKQRRPLAAIPIHTVYIYTCLHGNRSP